MFFDFSLGGHLPEGGIFCISKSMSDFFACLQGFCPFDNAKVVHKKSIPMQCNGMLTVC